jgi:hypothetical protein
MLINNRQSVEWANPFSKYRLEDWRVEEFPDNYRELVACFAPPDFMQKLEDPGIGTALFVMGGRGSGKSHILRMLSIQSLLKELEIKLNKEKIKVEQYKKPYFGVYLKSDCFLPLNLENMTLFNELQVKPLFEHYFNLQIVKALLDAIRFLFSNLEDSFDEEKIICSRLSQANGLCKGSSFAEVIISIDKEIGQIRNLVKLYPYDQDFEKYTADIHLSDSPDFIIDIFNVIRSSTEVLKGKSLFILVDEYEEMDVYQQELVNRLIRGRRLIFRVASKINGIKTIEYGKNKKLDPVHDYEIIPLHFDLVKENRSSYKSLLNQLFSKRLALNKGFIEQNPEVLLPSPTLEDEGLTSDDIDQELARMKQTLKRKKLISDEEAYKKNFRDHYKEAAIFRVLRRKSKDKLYAGFNEYVSLSSGIVRIFILLCREAFSSAHQNGTDIQAGQPIAVEIQSKAAREVSRIELTITIPQNVSSVYGQKLATLILDLGSILRAKLLFSTQPQANRIEILDSEKLELEEYRVPREIIESGLDLPVFLSEVSFKPRDVKYPMPTTFSLNWIFAPLLEIPPEQRWRTELRAHEVKELCSTETRESTLSKIITQVQGKERNIRNVKPESKYLNLETLGGKNAISLVNCPVTGFGCNQNLVRYDIKDKEDMAFLAAPFDRKNWVFDTRTLFKESMHQDFKIRCTDVDDANPKGGKILCKICSCVRQMPIGLFEITELNPNVIFELGMSTALNNLNFLLVLKEKIPGLLADFPPKPLENVEYVEYKLGRNAVANAIQQKIVPTVEISKKSSRGSVCFALRMQCPSNFTAIVPNQVFVGLPFDRNNDYFTEVQKEISSQIDPKKFNISVFHPSKTLSELCQMCDAIKKSQFCIIDTSYHDISMLFALGVAFGKDKQFIQLHNTQLSNPSCTRPISDLRPWAIEYSNLAELKDTLRTELSKRLEGLNDGNH